MFFFSNPIFWKEKKRKAHIVIVHQDPREKKKVFQKFSHRKRSGEFSKVSLFLLSLNIEKTIWLDRIAEFCSKQD